jgi:hypothetical protein
MAVILNPIAIHRSYWQRHHVMLGSASGPLVKHEPEFPVLYELAGWDESSSLESVEEWEGKKWEAGDDPIRESMDISEALTSCRNISWCK